MKNLNVSAAFILSTIFASIDSSSAFITPKIKIAGTTPKGAVAFSSTTSTIAIRNIELPALPPLEAFSSSFQVASVSLESITSSSLFIYFAEKVIETSIPAVFAVVVIYFFFSQFKEARGNAEKNDEAEESATAISELYNDLYSNTKGSGIMKLSPINPFFDPSRGGRSALPKNLGVPSREFLRVTSLNEKYDAYDFSITKVTDSKAKAAADFRSKSFDRALGLAMNAEPAVEGATVAEFLPPRVKAKLIRAEKKFLKSGIDKVTELQKLETTLASIAMDESLAKLGERAEQMNEDDLKVIDAEIEESSSIDGNEEKQKDDGDDKTKVEETKTKIDVKSEKKSVAQREELLKETMKLQKELKEMELDFMQQVLSAVGPKRAIGIRNAFLGDIAVRGTGSLLRQMEDRPLSTILKAGVDDTNRQKSLFVMDFPGDVQASQLNELREEVTGVIRNAQLGDEVLVVLQSGGGTVTGYGLAAGQLVRLKEKGLYLTIAVEQVAASGGYMMSCVADKIVASPFAVLGSIGVISEVPNVYERLKEEGIKFQTVTAGKFKRTLTPTKKITQEDLAKSEEDIAEIFNLFKGWVEQNRPQLDIEEVATGETWFGPAALEKGLCDDIKTVDDVLLEYVDNKFNVYEVKYDPPPEVPSTLSALFASDDEIPRLGSRNDSIGRHAIRWLVRSFAEEVKAVTTDYKSSDQKYMAKDETKDRVFASDEDYTSFF